MSTQHNTYIFHGVLLEYQKDSYEKYEKYIDSAFEGIKHYKGLCVLYDGMCGKYIIIGRVLYKTEEGQGLDKPLTLESPDLAMRELLADAIGNLYGMALYEHDVKTIVVTHYR